MILCLLFLTPTTEWIRGERILDFLVFFLLASCVECQESIIPVEQHLGNTNKVKNIMASAVYTKAASYYHWMVAAPLLGSIACVLKAQNSPKAEKGPWMHRHKSLGVLTGIVVLPRLGYRIMNIGKYKIEELPGHGPVQSMAASISHVALYAFMTVMPATGIAMGMYGGKGLPFFWTSIPGFEQKNGKLAGQSFKIHKTLGTYGKYLVPIHGGAAVGHYFTGAPKIFARINPFRGPPKH